MHLRSLHAGVAAIVLGAILTLAGALRAHATPDPRYYRYDQVIAQFEAWEQHYPEIFHREIVGYSGVGHEPIWACKVANHPGQHDPEPVLLFHGAQHANEANGTTAIMYTIERLLTRYGQDPYDTAIVDGLQTWFIPILNVDGHRMAFADAPNAQLWRKTVRDNNGDGLYTWPDDGVDANRNWDWRWAEDDSTSPGSEYYRGPSAQSEEEVRVIQDFVQVRKPLIVMDYHSPYQHTQSNMVFWTWLDGYGGPSAPDENIYQDVAYDLRMRTETESGQHYSGLPAYNTLPKEQNWIYAHTEICALLMEISTDGFFTGSVVDTIAARVGRGSYALMDRAMQGPGLAGRITNAVTGAPLMGGIKVESVSSPSIGPYLAEGEFGRYWRFLGPGTYTVTISAHHFQDRVEIIQVGSSGWTVRDFQLVPVGTNDVSGVEERPLVLQPETPMHGGGFIRFRLAEPRVAAVELFDLGGRLVRVLADRRFPAGASSIRWDGNDAGGQAMPSGIYLVRLGTADGFTTAKVVLTR